MKIIEIKPTKKFGGAWCAEEAPGVSPAFPGPSGKRKDVTEQIQTAKVAAGPRTTENEITPFESAARTMHQRGERYLDRMAGISEGVLPHLESLPPDEILHKARDLDYYDRVSRRTFGLNESQPLSNCPVNFAILCNQAAIVTASPTSESDPTP